MEHEYSVNIGPAQGAKVPVVRAQFGRITVILGVNGTGKSGVLEALKATSSTWAPNRPVIYVEGGRVVRVPDSIAVDRGTFDAHGTLERAAATHVGKRTTLLADRVIDAFHLLLRQGENLKIEHSDAVTAWKSSGMNGDCPDVPTAPLERLFAAFHEIFSDITLELAPKDKRILCKKGSAEYAPSKLSDGERQVLSILADIAHLADAKSVILVDEPELNLHGALANRLWNRIEADMPQALFVYATHNIGFAMRSGVSSVLALRGAGNEAIEIGSIADLEPREAREFLGAIPAIVARAATVVTEGEEDDSFDSVFYRWLLEGHDLGIICLGGSGDVSAVASRSGMWERLAPGIKIVGVTDKDYRPEERRTDEAGSGCLSLEYHEAESYLCHPRVLVAVATKLGSVAALPKESEVVGYLAEDLAKQQVRVAALRTFARAQVRLAVSIERRILQQAEDATAMRGLIADAARQEAAKSVLFVGEERATGIFEEELGACASAIADRDTDALLKLVPGKPLLNRLAPLVGCRDGVAVARAVRHHLKAQDFAHSLRLRDRIIGVLGPGQPRSG